MDIGPAHPRDVASPEALSALLPAPSRGAPTTVTDRIRARITTDPGLRSRAAVGRAVPPTVPVVGVAPHRAGTLS